jgi:hypothetical protein
MFRIPLWALLFCLSLLFLIIRIVLKLQPKEPLWIHYKSDFFKGMLFSWNYTNYFGVKEITDLRPICSKCRCELSLGGYGGLRESWLYCPSCDEKFEIVTRKTIEDVQKVITNKIMNDQYPKDGGE